MNVTEIRIKLMGDGPISTTRDRVRAYCSILIDGVFAVHDVKIVEGPGGLIVAMPSRKSCDNCPTCLGKNHLRARFCNGCGARLNEHRATALDPADGRAKLHFDVAHPINAACREAIQEAVLQAYAKEVEAYRLPGYFCRYDDYGANARGKGVERPDGGGRTKRVDHASSPKFADRLPVRGRA